MGYPYYVVHMLDTGVDRVYVWGIESGGHDNDREQPVSIGNRKDATAVWDHYNENRYGGLDGFASMGGGNRTVYATDDVVYKVQHSWGPYMRGFGNQAEYTHSRTLRKESDNGWIRRVYIPEVSGFSFRDGNSPRLVIAMERIHGDAASWGNDGLTPTREQALWDLFCLGFDDMHAGNYMWMPGHRVGVCPVDMGSARYRSPERARDNADPRVLSGTKMRDRLDKHREFRWRNASKVPGIAASCPCGCGLVRWDT